MAGKTLNFSGKVVDVRELTPEDLQGFAGGGGCSCGCEEGGDCTCGDDCPSDKACDCGEDCPDGDSAKKGNCGCGC